MEKVAKQDLIAQITRRGLDPPGDDLLRRLAVEGLLPRPTQTHPGRVRGSVTEYSAWAVEQAIGVLELHIEVHRFDNLRFWAFWEGLWVESRRIRRTLSNRLKELIQSQPRGGDPFKLAEAVAFPRSHDGAEDLDPDFQSGLFTVLNAAMGGESMWDSQPIQETTHQSEPEKPPTELAADLLTLSTLTNPIGEFGQLIETTPHPSAPLEQIAQTGIGNPGWWNHAIRAVPIAELLAARDTARLLVDGLGLFAQAVQREGIAEFPALLSALVGPGGRGAPAIRHCTLMVASSLAVNPLHDPDSIVPDNRAAFAGAADLVRDQVERA